MNPKRILTFLRQIQNFAPKKTSFVVTQISVLRRCNFLLVWRRNVGCCKQENFAKSVNLRSWFSPPGDRITPSNLSNQSFPIFLILKLRGRKKINPWSISRRSRKTKNLTKGLSFAVVCGGCRYLTSDPWKMIIRILNCRIFFQPLWVYSEG